jgi:hypothetical protein
MEEKWLGCYGYGEFIDMISVDRNEDTTFQALHSRLDVWLLGILNWSLF